MRASNLLVRATNWLGDAVMSLPALRALRQRFPEARITVLARPSILELYQREPFRDQTIPCPAFRGPGGWIGRWRLARRLRREGFDAAVLLPNSFDAALLVWMAGVPQRIGYGRDRRGAFLTHPVSPPEPGQHETLYYLELLRRAGIVSELPAAAPVLLAGAAEARLAGLDLFDRMGLREPIVGLSPGARNSRAKQWPPERFAEAAVLMAGSLRGSAAVFGSPEERALCRSVAEAIRRRGVPVLSLAGEASLGRFIEMAAACRVFLSNDSGAMHVASALGVPTVAVFGPTRWLETGPAGPVTRIVREPVECSPCMLRDCPIDHRCMTRITASGVAEAALELLK